MFREGREQKALQRAETADTTLTAYFKLNARDQNARQYYYNQILEHYVWETTRKSWKNRLQGGHLIIG